MKALIVYESMFGNTHAVAEAVAAGLRPAVQTEVRRVAEVAPEAVAEADLLVVGAPDPCPRPLPDRRRRQAAAESAEPADSGLSLEPDAQEVGVSACVSG